MKTPTITSHSKSPIRKFVRDTPVTMNSTFFAVSALMLVLLVLGNIVSSARIGEEMPEAVGAKSYSNKKEESDWNEGKCH